MKKLLIIPALFFFVGCKKTYYHQPQKNSYSRDTLNNDTVFFNNSGNIIYKHQSFQNCTFYLDATNAQIGNEYTIITPVKSNTTIRAYSYGSVFNNSFTSSFDTYVTLKIEYLGIFDSIPVFSASYTYLTP